MCPKEIVVTDKALGAVGPYSQAVKFNGMVYTSGCIGMVMEDGSVPPTIEEQTHIAMTHLTNIVEAAGSSLDKIIKITVFLKNMDDFSKFNAIYGSIIPKPYPARSCVEVARLPKDVLVELEAIASLE
eukprot:gnl/Dysnectes_brevis/203_a232_9657.p1 GENE.gnl/Dysnectes_brevis/203_a232_9657~~gnl/Dysnectes_brevis/203_a232_9657.p1  ORF type:complete len:128 (+),score=21.13 gnl/Dysnectes_brevis/203_a232_9657:79-462(+)